MNGLLRFAVVPCIGQLARTLTGVFFLIGWIYMPQFFQKYGKYPAKNPGSCYFIVTIWWWSFPHSEYGLWIKWSRYKSTLSLATMGAGSWGQPIVPDFPYCRTLFKNFTNSGMKSWIILSRPFIWIISHGKYCLWCNFTIKHGCQLYSTHRS